MKTLFTLVLFLSFCQKPYCQEIVDAKELGLVGYLTYVKEVSEYKMTFLVEDPNYTAMPDKAKLFNSDYNLLKLSTDQLINQLSADLFNCNRLKLYRRLDKYLQDQKALPKKYKHYELLLNQIDSQLTALLVRKYTGGALAGPGLDIITGMVTEVREITTSARDFREKKIQSIHSLMKELKMTTLSEIKKSKEKDSKD